jgi:hypothetical protein
MKLGWPTLRTIVRTEGATTRTFGGLATLS